MPDKKFNALSSGGNPTKKDFHMPDTHLIQSKPTVILGKVLVNNIRKEFINTGTELEDAKIKDSAIFNRPIYCDITFFGGSYTDQNNQTINYDGLNIEDVLVTVGNTKNIIETTLQGRNGTVKEYISDGDYVITITGKIYGKGMNNYPQQDVQKLHNICTVPQTIKVTSTFLKMFNVEDIVVKSYTIDQMEGIRNYQPFTLNCVSDYPLILLKNA